jgi:hypothetical protein
MKKASRFEHPFARKSLETFVCQGFQLIGECMKIASKTPDRRTMESVTSRFSKPKITLSFRQRTSMKTALVIASLVALLLGGCKPSEPQIIAPQAKYCFTVEHHGLALPDVQVYLKYNTAVFPGSNVSLYDTMVVSDGQGEGCFVRLPVDTHMIYATGFDTAFGMPVSGSQQIIITSLNEEGEGVLLVTE